MLTGVSLCYMPVYIVESGVKHHQTNKQQMQNICIKHSVMEDKLQL